MRIERLDLIAFGGFDDYSLDLAGSGVHLIYGLNEAGKSTTLGALDQLLYGIDHQTRYAFRHANRTRLGARLSAADGVALEIVRRKKRKDALVDGDGTPLTEEALAPFLGDVDRRTFTTEFALNSDELRKGGELLASGAGDMAQLLAAARSGMRLNAVLKKIEERQRALYLNRGRTNPRINVGLGRLRDVRPVLRDAILRPDEYRNAERAVAEADGHLGMVTAELTEKRRLCEQRRQLRAKHSDLLRHRALTRQIEELRAQGPAAPDDIREQFPDLIKEEGEREAVRSSSGQALARADDQLAESVEDDSHLQHAAAIDRLTREITAILAVVGQREDSTGEATRKRAAAQSRLRTVHPQATLADQQFYRIPHASIKKGKQLRDEGRKYQDDLDRAGDAVQRWRGKGEQANKRLSALPGLEDVSQLRDALAAVPADLLTRPANTETKAAQLDRRFRQARSRLGFPEWAPAAVLELRVPEREQITEAENALRALDRREDEHSGNLDRERRRLVQLRKEFERLLTGDAPPTDEDLRVLRAERDDLVARFLTDPSLGAALRDAIKSADDTVDLMLRYAEQVQQRANLAREIADLEAAVPDHRAMLDEVLVERTEAWHRWETLWESWPAATPEIAQAPGVLADFDKLRSDTQELQDLRIDLDEQHRSLNAYTARLAQLLRLDGDEAPTTAGTACTAGTAGTAGTSARLAEMMETAQVRLDEHEENTKDRATAQHDLANAEAELAQAQSDEARANAAVADHGEAWRLFLREAGLPADRDADTALSDLETLLKVTEDVEAAAEAEDDVLQHSRRISEFQELMENTLRSCGREVPASISDWKQAIDTLAEDLQEQRNEAQRRKALRHNRADLAETVADAEAALSGIRSRLQTFCTRLDIPSRADLEAAVNRAAELREKLTALASTQDSLQGVQDLDRLREQAEQTSIADLDAELADLDAQIARLDEAKDERLRQRTERQQELDGLNGGSDAATTAAEIAQICAELAEDAEEFLRLEAARIAILACMEEYRNSDQEPVLARASELFVQLSRGSYAGLELSDEERPSIRATSSTGTPLAPTALSEGTRDQLYLALRLATLERHAAVGNALPIAVDDIFMTFDERRTEAALRVLDGMADRFQVIVFTHHEHVIRSAVKELPEGRCHVHQLLG